jgi:hypothetical protein
MMAMKSLAKWSVFGWSKGAIFWNWLLAISITFLPCTGKR